MTTRASKIRISVLDGHTRAYLPTSQGLASLFNLWDLDSVLEHQYEFVSGQKGVMIAASDASVIFTIAHPEPFLALGLLPNTTPLKQVPCSLIVEPGGEYEMEIQLFREDVFFSQRETVRTLLMNNAGKVGMYGGAALSIERTALSLDERLIHVCVYQGEQPVPARRYLFDNIPFGQGEYKTDTVLIPMRLGVNTLTVFGLGEESLVAHPHVSYRGEIVQVQVGGGGSPWNLRANIKDLNGIPIEGAIIQVLCSDPFGLESERHRCYLMSRTSDSAGVAQCAGLPDREDILLKVVDVTTKKELAVTVPRGAVAVDIKL